jgi:hypothetical protein
MALRPLVIDLRLPIIMGVSAGYKIKDLEGAGEIAP